MLNDPSLDVFGDTYYSLNSCWRFILTLALWFIIFTILLWLIYYTVRPGFVINSETNQVDPALVTVAALITAFIVELAILIIKALTGMR